MLRYLSFFILLTSITFTSCKNKKSASEERNPNLKIRPESPLIKSIKKYNRNGKSDADSLVQLDEFDKNGYKIHTIKYAPGSSMEYEIFYTNNEKGKPVRVETKYPDGTINTEEHIYNEDGKVTATNWKRSDGTSGRHEYKYDDEGTLVQWDWLEGKRFIVSRLYPTTYTDFGKPLESYYKETSNNRDTNTVNHYQFTYDPQHRLIRKLSMENERPIALEEYVYDTLGNQIVEIFYEPDSANAEIFTVVHKQFNTFNEFGEITNYQNAAGKGDIDLNVTNTYDKYGHQIKTVYEYADARYYEEKTVYEYWDSIKS